MKKLLFFGPAAAFLLLLAAGLNYTHMSLTGHNLGFQFSRKTNTAQRADLPKSPAVLRILSYNVHGVPNSKSFWCNNLIDIGKKLGKMRRQGVAPHVVAIQEGFHEKVHDLVALSGYPYVEQGPVGDAREMTSGLWILSEYPITINKNLIYNACGSWDCLSNKGIQYVALTIPGYGGHTIEVFNTHMNSELNHDFWTSTKNVAAAKLQQVQQMKDYFFRTHKPGAATIVAGDFNFRKGSLLYERFLDLVSLDNVADMLLGSMAPQLLDHQWFLQGKDLKLFPRKFKTMFNKSMSDHLGVEVVYELKHHQPKEPGERGGGA